MVVPSLGINFDMYYIHVHVHVCFKGHCIYYLHLWYPLQYGVTQLAARRGRTACVERLLFTPCIDVNIKNSVSFVFPQ